MELNGKRVRGLLDTGCSNTIVRTDLVQGFKGVTRVRNFHGDTTVSVPGLHMGGFEN